MDIVDSQIHAFYPDTSARPWTMVPPRSQGPQFTRDQALATMDAAGVRRAILVLPSWTRFDNEYCLVAARAEPDRFAVMGRFDVDAPDAPGRLARWREQPGMLGIRIFFMGEPWLSVLADRRYDWFWEACEAQRLPLMGTVPGRISAFAPVLDRWPRLRLIIDHAGRHPLGPMDDDAWADADQLHALARYPDVAVKLSSLPSFSTQPYPFVNLHPHVRTLVDLFGSHRLLWGSGVTRLTSTYDENLRLFTEALTFLTDEDRLWIMGRAASRACDWPPDFR